jgi:O-acetyl-ADP-ribose deacetylase (regulator of RNase III)
MGIVISESEQGAKPFIECVTLSLGNIADQDVDAIAMVIPRNLDFCGGINRSIAQAAGYDVDGFILENIYKPTPMEVYALPGGNLPAKNILVGILPYYRSEFDRQDRDLSNIVRKIMELARCMLVSRVAIPPLASGRKVFPKQKATRLIVQGVMDRMYDAVEEVHFVCSDEKSFQIFDERLSSLEV